MTAGSPVGCGAVSYFGTIVLARAKDLLLPQLPQVRAAFGSRSDRLEDLGDGWQLLYLLTPLPHEWPTVGAGPADLAAATREPVLAAWISDIACMQVSGAIPDGTAWSAHVTDDPAGVCEFDHHRFALLRLPPGTRPAPPDPSALTGHLLEWAGAAGQVTQADRINAAAALPSYPDAFRAVVTALGFPAEGTWVPPKFDLYSDPDVYAAWEDAYHAGYRRCREWTSRLGRKEPEPPWEADYLRFAELLSTSMFGDGASAAQLRAEAARLDDRWTALRNADWP
jgi:hypothetical protein